MAKLEERGMTTGTYAREDSESIASVDRKANMFLYGQPDAPANIQATERLSTADEMIEAFREAGWTITGGDNA